ncbi:spore protease YyaC [Halalkalibacterium halodurans]|uniref:spore protease YyaC n=1 Tax=Halalkalibacterium halodurans TaxID=86665 RepID=UPI002E1C1680|nr:spore protease YyaC [Halalkalibacterium halodurans]MED4084894.1 spore protease YyaC [Halalkalibacterium halodurans]MED4103486.1 spore protease YyaC [Halalkalibacterium halodurans]MED4107738.1 spore protease YyaC [Halalkalibacterium halodurans]MED4123446.1 spore protease YyaC [Halalkalibacterium halodurans]
MNGNRFFSKKPPPFRVHMDDPQASDQLVEQLLTHVSSYRHRELVIVCIGTDRSTGDALGPIVGTALTKECLNCFHVYGTLAHPVHAVNLEEKLKLIEKKHRRPFIIAIDACLGKLSSVGKVSLAAGPVQPGAAVNKKLPAVGDVHLTGIVNIGGMMEYFVLQNTRLHTVMQLADTISSSLVKLDQQFIKLTEKQRKSQTILQSLGLSFQANKMESQ